MHIIRLLFQTGESHHKNILHEVITVYTTQHVQVWFKVDTGDFHIMIMTRTGKNHNGKCLYNWLNAFTEGFEIYCTQVQME